MTGTNSYLNTLYLSWTPENYQLKIVYLIISSVSSPKLQHQPTQKKFTIFRKLKTIKRICFNSLWHYHAIHKIHFCWTKKLTYSTKITTNITYNCITITFKTLQKRFYSDLTCYIFSLKMLFWPKGFNELDKQTKETTDILCYYCNIGFCLVSQQFIYIQHGKNRWVSKELFCHTYM